MMDPIFAFHAWRRDIGNASLFKYRDFQGFIVSSPNSGTQWLKSMLGHALARSLGLPPPRYANNDAGNDYIGHPKHPRLYPGAPRLASTHSIPHPWIGARPIRSVMRFPPYLVLVRDMRAAMVSYYEKWKDRYGISFAEFVRGERSGNSHWADIWWHIRFANRWGRVLARHPGATALLRYEDLQADPLAALRRVDAHFALGLGDDALAHGIAESTKEKMAARAGPARVAESRERFVRFDDRDPLGWYGPSERALVAAILRRNLRYALGYDYSRWPDAPSA